MGFRGVDADFERRNSFSEVSEANANLFFPVLNDQIRRLLMADTHLFGSFRKLAIGLW